MRTAISFSRVNLYEQCDFAYNEKHNHKTPEAPSDPLIGGGLFHDWAEWYVKNLIASGRQTDLDDATAIAGVPGEANYETYSDIRTLFLKWSDTIILEEGVETFPEMMLAFNEKWEQVEWDADDVFLRMKIDRVDIKGSAITITDYKTARAIPEKNLLQLRTYAFGVNLIKKTNGPITVVEEFVRFGVKREVTIEYDDYKDVGEWYFKQADKIAATTEWKATTNSWCNFCGFKNQCPKYETDFLGTNLDASTPEKAVELAEYLYAMKNVVSEAEKTLKAVAIDGGPIQVGDLQYGPSVSKTYSFHDVEGLVKELRERSVPSNRIWDKLSLNKTSLEALLKVSGLKGKEIGMAVDILAGEFGSEKPFQRFGFKKSVAPKKTAAPKEEVIPNEKTEQTSIHEDW